MPTSMEGKIFSCSISSLLLCLLFCLPVDAQTMNNGSQLPVAHKQKKENKPEVEYPFYNGTYVGVELWGIANSILGSDYLSTEVTGIVDLKHRYFPTIEVGYGETDAWGDQGIHYKSHAPYLRVGGDYNSLYKKAHGQALLVGLRYGISSFNYDIHSLGLDDPIYGGGYNPNITDDVWKESIPYDHRGMKSTMQWVELCVGVRAHVWKSIYMGWSLRFKFKLSASCDRYGDPWYVPGYGKYGSNTTGITYNIIYKLPL